MGSSPTFGTDAEAPENMEFSGAFSFFDGSPDPAAFTLDWSGAAATAVELAGGEAGESKKPVTSTSLSCAVALPLRVVPGDER